MEINTFIYAWVPTSWISNKKREREKEKREREREKVREGIERRRTTRRFTTHTVSKPCSLAFQSSLLGDHDPDLPPARDCDAYLYRHHMHP